MSKIELMNEWTDQFYEEVAGILLEDKKKTVNRKKVADILGVDKDQLTNAVWNGTLDIGYGHRSDDAAKRNTEFLKAKVWRYVTGYTPKCMRQE